MPTKLTIQEMCKIAEKRGGRCLSNEYVNSSVELEWQCHNGHHWWAKPKQIKGGTWCPICAKIGRRNTIENMQLLAKEHNGQCLSTEYINHNTPLTWQCEGGHNWTATPKNVKRGSWCPLCNQNSSNRKRRKITLQYLEQEAQKRGGRCLSERYVNYTTKLKWECAHGHQWETAPREILSGYWCPVCGGSKKLTIMEMQAIAKPRNGKCLSTRYINGKTPLLWECEQGHKWKAAPITVKNGTWCPFCAKNVRLTIHEMKELAKKHKGKCLSDVYVNSKTKLLWECEKGHQFVMAPDDVKGGHWCAVCGGTAKLSIDEMRRIAKKHRGKCISSVYTNNKTRLKWECAEGHQFKMTPDSVKQGHWCPECGGVRRRTLDEMQQIAKERGGKCLSIKFVNTKTKLLWQCAEGHQWEMTFDSIRFGCWCPECSSGLGERICRAFFEQLFARKFPRSYPKWLKSPNGNRMELDGYCKELNLAFEHHGEHHYSTRVEYSSTQEDLQKRREYDKHKRELCQNQGVILIEVPEIPNRLGVNEVKVYIKQQCLKQSLVLPIDFETKAVSLKKAYATSYSRKTLQELRKIAEAHEGICLSEFYIDKDTKLQWKCAQGHLFIMTPHHVKQGHWCPRCGGTGRLNIDDMIEIATSRGGKVLSPKYVNNRTKLLWQCRYGHQWKATPHAVKDAQQWCPYCAGNRKGTIEEMQRLAEKRGGKCLSDNYVNRKTKLLWECAKDHQWEARPSDIKRGSWCPSCAGRLKTTKRL